MSTAEVRRSPKGSANRFTPLQGLIHDSTLRTLGHSLQSSASQAALHSLKKVRNALRMAALGTALREMDRSWRSFPDDVDTLAPIYSRLLALEDRNHDATLNLLERVVAPDPDVAALSVHALLQLRRGEDARRQLQRALGEYCLDQNGLLAYVATEVLQHPDTQASGWLGLSATLEYIGELASSEAVRGLQIQLGERGEFVLPIRATRRDGRLRFRFKLPGWTPGALLRVSSRGTPLLGSGNHLPSTFTLDGRAGTAGRNITGWARLGWLPTQPARLCFQDEAGHRHLGKSRPVALPGLRWPFKLDPRSVGLRGHRVKISVQLPDGRWEPLPDAPLLLEPAVRLPPRRTEVVRPRPATPSTARTAWCDVIIPVFRGLRETLACINAAITTVDSHTRIIVVDDATEEKELATAMEALAADRRITLLRNDANLGFVASVNRALALHPADDAVLLNSDTQVFGDWLARLRATAYSAPKIGTVTPLSNSGSIASYPRAEEQALSPEDGATLHELAASVHSGVSAELPVGVGFCLYLRRDCLREVGALDAAVFGRGYGEETDFCLRARRRGWSHRLAADVFVYHAGGVSFGKERSALFDRSQRLLNIRHPGFARTVTRFAARDPLLKLRRRLDERRLAAFEGQFVLLVTLAMGGGVQRFVDERCRAIREQGLFPILLRPLHAGDAHKCELWTDAIDVPNLHYEIPDELAGVTALLGGLRLAAVELQHFLHLDARVIETVRALGTPYDVYVHDYAWICPRVTLIDGSGRYCGEPDVSVCKTCVRRNGSNLAEAISVPALRARSEQWLRAARRVIAPTHDSAQRLQSYFPALDIDVRAHAEPLAREAHEARPSPGANLRVALIGAIGTHKGYKVLLGCARDARARRLPLEFVVIGHTENDAALLKTGKVFVTGRYGEGEAPHLLRREQPDLAFLPSVWPETWSYALDEALEAGLPVVAFDLGAIAERLRATGSGDLLPLHFTARQINDRLLQQATQSQSTPDRDGAIMRTPGDNLMTKTSEVQSAPQDGLSASVQILPLPPGLYLFSVKSDGPAAKPGDGQLQLPAMHVGLGPGVSFDQVEFIAGPSTNGAWLFAHEDLLITKVKGSAATLVLTSVRGTGGEVLSIKVERLDTRTEVTSAPVQAPAPAPAKAARPSALSAAIAATMTAKVGQRRTASDAALPIHIATHIRSRGDMNFSDVPWAGRVAPGLWIESFSVRPLEHFGANDIEYKALTGSGYETAWISDDEMCGTKGFSVPLVGFAVRLKPSALTAAYDCEYSGYFKSGLTVGPLHNGAPCRSTVANDPLEGIQVRITKRAAARAPALAELAARPLATLTPRHAPGQGPSFGRFREAGGNGSAALRKSGKPKAASKPAASTRGKSRRGPSPRRRS